MALPALYLDNYKSNLENVPKDLQRSFSLMRELDSKVQASLDSIYYGSNEELYERFSSIKDDDKRREKIEKYLAIYDKCDEYTSEKMEIASNTYNMVDKHIRRLDNDLQKFEKELAILESGKKNKKKKNIKKKRESVYESATATKISMDLDIPVDPNEPTYCTCHQVSYGEMVACDNINCQVEWFHFACVGLTKKPPSKWLCPKCKALKEK